MAEFIWSAEWDGSSLERGLLESLKKIEGAAADSGAKTGDAWSKSASKQVNFDEAVKDQLQEAARLAAKAGADAVRAGRECRACAARGQ